MMDGKRTLVVSFILALIGTFLTTVCYFWVDKPLALWVHAHQISNNYGWLVYFTFIKIPISILTCCIYILYVIKACVFGFSTIMDKNCLFVANCLFFSDSFQNRLGAVVGRYWPNTWIDNNLSLTGTGDYGFILFPSGNAYESFPSGHTTVIVALCAALWLLYPKLKIIYIIAVFAMILGLISMNYHFLGDCVAGLFIALIFVNLLAYLHKLSLTRLC